VNAVEPTDQLDVVKREVTDAIAQTDGLREALMAYAARLLTNFSGR
jgi:hypothetical protein